MEHWKGKLGKLPCEAIYMIKETPESIVGFCKHPNNTNGISATLFTARLESDK